MEKKTITELAAMSGEELRAYWVSLPQTEQEAFNEELNKALELTTSKYLVDNLPKNTNNSWHLSTSRWESKRNGLKIHWWGHLEGSPPFRPMREPVLLHLRREAQAHNFRWPANAMVSSPEIFIAVKRSRGKPVNDTYFYRENLNVFKFTPNHYTDPKYYHPLPQAMPVDHARDWEQSFIKKCFTLTELDASSHM